MIFQAEARAEFAERSVQKLQKEVDRLEGIIRLFYHYLLFSFIFSYRRVSFLFNFNFLAHKFTIKQLID